MLNRKNELGYINSPETRARISAAQKGRKYPDRHIPCNPEKKEKLRLSNLGKTRSADTRRRNSEAKRQENHPRWQGGLTALNKAIRNCFEYTKWRTEVFLRDNFACTEPSCLIAASGNLEAHHIEPLAQLIRDNNIRSVTDAISCAALWDITNGRTLCKPCHEKTDSYFFKSKIWKQ